MVATLFAIAEEADPTRFVLPHTTELVWGSLAFLILVGVLTKLAFPKINEMLQERTNRIRQGLESAERAKADADTLVEQYRQRLAEARNEGNKIVEEAKKTAEALRRDIVAKAEAEAAEIVNRARAEVGAERDRALNELRGTIGDLSLTLAERVVGRELANEAAQRAFIDQTLTELVAAGNGQRS